MSVKKMSNGTWMVRTRYKNAQGVWKEKKKRGVESERKAKMIDLQFLQEIEDGVIDEKEWTLRNFLDTFFDLYKSDKTYDTKALYQIAFKQICDYFGEQTKINTINSMSYQGFINDLGKTRALETVRTRHKKLHAAFKKWYDLDYIKKDPTLNVELTGNDLHIKKIRYINGSEMELIATTIKDKYEGSTAFIMIAVKTGMRFSEIAALTWNDIDSEKQTITIDKSWDYKDKHTFKLTKTNRSNRTIFVDSKLIAYLKRYKTKQSALLLSKGANNKLDLLFDGGTGRPISNNAVNKALALLCEKLEIEKITAHKLRHSRTIQLFEAGADLKYISDSLGHESIKTTLDIYTHVSDNLKKINDKRVEDMFSKFG